MTCAATLRVTSDETVAVTCDLRHVGVPKPGEGTTHSGAVRLWTGDRLRVTWTLDTRRVD